MTPEPAVNSVTYRVVAGDSKLTVQAFAEGLFSAFGHDPVIAATEFNGELQFEKTSFEDASLRISIASKSLKVVSEIKEKDRLEIEQTMHVQVLETNQYSKIEFKLRDQSFC